MVGPLLQTNEPDSGMFGIGFVYMELCEQMLTREWGIKLK